MMKKTIRYTSLVITLLPEIFFATVSNFLVYSNNGVYRENILIHANADIAKLNIVLFIQFAASLVLTTTLFTKTSTKEKIFGVISLILPCLIIFSFLVANVANSTRMNF
jgi:hypothetical protein